MSTLVTGGMVLPMSGGTIAFDPGALLFDSSSILAVASRLSVEEVLQQLVDSARELAGARDLQAALGDGVVVVGFDGAEEGDTADAPKTMALDSPQTRAQKEWTRWST